MTRWQAADESVARRLAEWIGGDGWAGHDAGDMPDSVWILHAMFERADGGPISPIVWGPGPQVVPELQRLRWSKYAQRYGVPMVPPGHRPGIYALPGVHERPSIDAPREGVLEQESWAVLLEHLTAISPDGPDTACAAFFTTPSGDQQHAAYVGVLGDALELLDLDIDGSGGPQNVWDLAETWIVYTDYDGWATRVSGPADLITRLLDDDRLETERLPDVPERE